MILATVTSESVSTIRSPVYDTVVVDDWDIATFFLILSALFFIPTFIRMMIILFRFIKSL